MPEGTDQNTPDNSQGDSAPKPATRKKAEPDPYKDYDNAEAFPAVLLLATGEKVGAPSIQSTEHWSRELKCNVPVVGVLTR